MLPFLKDKKEGGMSGPVETKKMGDDSESYDMLDAIAEDMIQALHKKDKELLKGALEALVEHIKAEDEIQDES